MIMGLIRDLRELRRLARQWRRSPLRRWIECWRTCTGGAEGSFRGSHYLRGTPFTSTPS